MNTNFFTNQESNTLFSKLEGIFENNPSINNFDALVGYFRSSGYFKLRPLLENVANIRILVGIDVDGITAQMQEQGLSLFKGDSQKTVDDWINNKNYGFLSDIQQANYEQKTEDGIKQFIADMASGKVILKAHPSKAIHAKIYIFRPDNFNQHAASSVITGSSNLTDAGLGTKPNPNYEFNVLLNDFDDVDFATKEFEKLWQEGIDILPEVAQNSLKKTHLADDITPYELYLKMLIEYFGDDIEFDPNSIRDLPNGFKRLSYQMDAVNEGWGMLKKHNGFFLSDVVGLGKTMIATLIARQFYYHNGYPDYRSKILLIIPPALKQNWSDTLQKFKLDDAVKIITNGSLHKIKNAKDFDMVIVDEAHKFRNNTADSYDQLQIICKTKTTDGKAKKVMLISATPLNNRPDDLYNQILLFQDGNNSTLDFPLASFFAQVKKQYQEILKLADKRAATQQTKRLYEQIRQRVITPLMVRRTRTDLLDNERYKEDLDAHNIVFPETTSPQLIDYQLESNLNILYDNTIKKIDNKKQDSSGLLHTRYRALHYLKPDKKQQYQRADFIAERLVAIMKTLLLKRMDSSFYAFKQTLERFIQSSEIMLKMIENNQIIIAPKININDYILNDKDDELMELLANESLTDPSIIICSCDDFETGFVEGVQHDYKMLKQLKSDWDKITKDPKVDKFLAKLPDFLAQDKNPEQKIVIFTESTDTMNYLSEKITNTDFNDKTLVINASNRNQLKQTIRENFDANINAQDKKNAYQIILTTDVLAEGVNLHRANTVINYDTPWNATKLIQRIGRVNRIGQVASHIFVYNFYPTEQINQDIGLEKKALIKLQAFHSALGEDSQIYSTEEETGTFGIFDENIQAEENQTLPFLEEIRKYREHYQEDYKRLKDLPSKVRCSVDNKQNQGATLVFTRTEDKGSSRFYLVTPKTVDNYDFIKAAKLLKCTPETKATKLHDQHYPQVLSALNTFKDEMQQNIVNSMQNKTLSSVDNKAINFLKAMQNLPQTNKDEQEKIKQAIQQLENKAFPNLTRDINKLAKNIKGIKPIVVLEKALKIIGRYDINQHIQADKKEEKIQDTQPTIVISQSYV
ncbi:FIG003033: Helicase domain protein [uncultured Candidatus Thioglobus sp.]|nr:FIG003033: Helicase domain protein [uncultured Candidatus Thioglobus sp.]